MVLGSPRSRYKKIPHLERADFQARDDAFWLCTHKVGMERKLPQFFLHKLIYLKIRMCVCARERQTETERHRHLSAGSHPRWPVVQPVSWVIY